MQAHELVKQSRRIRLRTRRLVDGAFAGHYHSVFKGRGMEFADVREYAPGDDVRSIDWNVTARMGCPYVKRYVEERELTVLLLVDVSASSRFGTGAKLKVDVATELCSVLAMAALSNNDKVGLVLFTDSVERYVIPQKGRSRGLRVVREMLGYEPRGRGTDVARALRFADRVCRRRAVCFVVSDFIDSGYESSLRRAGQRHDVVPVYVGDPREIALPNVGMVRLADSETGRQLVIDTAQPGAREAFASAAARAAQERRRMFRGSGMDSIEVATDGDYVRALRRFFHRREQRLLAGR